MLCVVSSSSNSTAIFELSIYFDFGAISLPFVVGDLMFSSDSLLEFYAMIVSVSPVNILKVLKIGRNIK